MNMGECKIHISSTVLRSTTTHPIHSALLQFSISLYLMNITKPNSHYRQNRLYVNVDKSESSFDDNSITYVHLYV